LVSIYGNVVSTISALATIFTAILAFITFKRYVLKKSYFGEEAKERFEALKLDGYKSETKPFEGGKNKIFPNLLIEKKWWKITKVTYYVEEEDSKKKIIKTWFN
jgi:hypothetical protein